MANILKKHMEITTEFWPAHEVSEKKQGLKTDLPCMALSVLIFPLPSPSGNSAGLANLRDTRKGKGWSN